jgi:hypothetical protein
VSNKKSSFQTVSFKNVNEFLEFIPAHELKLVEALRGLVFDCIPACTEKLAYNVPFYYRHARICFIWPSSVAWGKSKEHGVRLGFENGYLLKDEMNFLDRGNRKQVYWKDFYSLSEIDPSLIRSFVFQAAEVDERLHKANVK